MHLTCIWIDGVHYGQIFHVRYVVEAVLSGTPIKGEFALKQKLGHEIPVYYNHVPIKGQRIRKYFDMIQRYGKVLQLTKLSIPASL